MKKYLKVFLGGMALSGFLIMLQILGSYFLRGTDWVPVIRPIRDFLLWPLMFPTEESTTIYCWFKPSACIPVATKGLWMPDVPSWFVNLMVVVGFSLMLLVYSGVVALLIFSRKTLCRCWARFRSRPRSS